MIYWYVCLQFGVFKDRRPFFPFFSLLLGFEIPQFRNMDFFHIWFRAIWRTQEGLESVRVIYEHCWRNFMLCTALEWWEARLQSSGDNIGSSDVAICTM